MTALGVAHDPAALTESFKRSLRGRHRPIAVVSAFDGSTPVGCAVSAFMTLSMDPASVVVSLRSTSSTLRHVLAGGRFGLSSFDAPPAELVETFSTGVSTERFRRVSHRIVGKVPVLDAAAARLVCLVDDTNVVFDHTLVFGVIEQVDL